MATYLPPVPGASYTLPTIPIGDYYYLPNVSWSDKVPTDYTPKPTLDDTASDISERDVTITALGEIVPIIYGRSDVGARIFAVAVHDNKLILGALWCVGECEAVEKVYINGSVITAGITRDDYLGTTTQQPASILVSAIANYDDSMVASIGTEAIGICYSVFRINPGVLNGFPRLTAVIQGRKVWDPRNLTSAQASSLTYQEASSTMGSTVFTKNPALCTADFLASRIFGPGRDLNLNSVISAANFCSTHISGTSTPRWEMGLTMDKPAEVYKWADTLRTYGNFFIYSYGSTIFFRPDTVEDTGGLTVYDENDIINGSLKMTKSGILKDPTVMRVNYTDTTTDPWRDHFALVKVSKVDLGTKPWVESVIRLPGIQSYQQAYRQATQRLNRLRLSDLSVQFETFDAGILERKGNLIKITHPYGLTNKIMRVTGVQLVRPGRWRVSTVEYQPNIYTDEVQNAPVFPDTQLPSAGDIPAITGLTVQEEIYQLQTGYYSSRIRINWNAITGYYYQFFYDVQVFKNSVLVWSTTTSETTFATGAIQELTEYVIYVKVVTPIGTSGTAASTSITPQGKYLAPDPVSNFDGNEIGGRVRLWWDPVADIDIESYEIRYSTTGQDWESATRIDRTDSLRYETTIVPEGTWRFHIKAIDSVGNYSSGTASHLDLVVDVDTNAYSEYHDYTSTSEASGIVKYTLGRTDGKVHRWISEDGVAWNTKYSSNLNTYTDVLACYHTTLPSKFVSEEWDIGYDLSGSFIGEIESDCPKGGQVINESILTKASGGTYTTTSDPMSLKTVARYAKLQAVASATATLRIFQPTTRVRVTSVPRLETGQATTPDDNFRQVKLTYNYVQAKAIVVTPTSGSSPVTYVTDNVVVDSVATCSFDVWIFNSTGSAIAHDFYWEFYGI